VPTTIAANVAVTSDLSLAAFWEASGLELVETFTEGRTVFFRFADPDSGAAYLRRQFHRDDRLRGFMSARARLAVMLAAARRGHPVRPRPAATLAEPL
jgi:hypothetical protein